MSLFVCSKCGCIDNTATSCYWALIRPCKNRIYDKSLKGYEGKPLCSECAAIEYSKGGEVVVVPGTWHGKFKKEWPTEEEKRFRFSYSRGYEGNVKQIRIVRETCSRFSLIIVTDHNHSNSYRKTHDGASIGLDFGLKTYLTKSDGSKIDSPLFFKQYQNRIRKLNKRLSNAKKGSNNRRRRLFELQQTYRKINDLRSDFQWGLAHQLCKQYDYIFIEDLNIEGMKRLWGKKVSDLSHSSFIDKLTYVASKYGVTIHKIDKWYPSSKTCECGCINKGLSLRDRTWVCPACGAVNDRDVLAARNILRKGISELESMGNSSDSNIGVSCVCIQESHSL